MECVILGLGVGYLDKELAFLYTDCSVKNRPYIRNSFLGRKINILITKLLNFMAEDFTFFNFFHYPGHS
ncbi:hypothetical protein NQ317_019068 [Molorchus minor]|uniref:Uncharacterized protein n=1 Tax=Molorchus minor TaxID=1323400 RepID=A0ABQ9J0P0_9CUCU|nr:hypothetical protein NQ317_019068 [Molorchus minor]